MNAFVSVFALAAALSTSAAPAQPGVELPNSTQPVAMSDVPEVPWTVLTCSKKLIAIDKLITIWTKANMDASNAMTGGDFDAWVDATETAQDARDEAYEGIMNYQEECE